MSVEELLIIYTTTNDNTIKELSMKKCHKIIINYVNKLFNNWTEPKEEDFDILMSAILLIFNRYNIPTELFIELQNKIINLYNEKFNK